MIRDKGLFLISLEEKAVREMTDHLPEKLKEDRFNCQGILDSCRRQNSLKDGWQGISKLN
jgi:hypothetical protein